MSGLRIYIALLLLLCASAGCDSWCGTSCDTECTLHSDLDAEEHSPAHIDPCCDEMVRIDANKLFESDGFDFMNIVSDIRFIPLETTDSSRLGRIERLVVTGDHIYASDSRGVCIFSRDGSFVRRLAYMGRNAALRHDFAYDFGTESLTLLSGERLTYHTADGYETGSTTTLDYAESIAAQDGRTILCANDKRHIVQEQDGCHREMDLTGRSTVNIDRRLRCPQSNGMRTTISVSFCDTIFTYSGDSLKASYAIDYETRRLPDSASEDDERTLTRSLLGTNNYYFGGEAVETASTLFFKLRTYRAQTVIAYYDKLSGALTGGICPLADFLQIPPIFEPLTTVGDDFASVFNPYQVDEGKQFRFLGNKIAEAEKDKIAHVRHEDNPIVALFRLKIASNN